MFLFEIVFLILLILKLLKKIDCSWWWVFSPIIIKILIILGLILTIVGFPFIIAFIETILLGAH